MLLYIVGLSFSVLMLAGQFNTKAESVGLGNHIIEEGKVTLTTDSKVVTTKEDLEEYKKSFADACDVDFDPVGNIILHYKSQGTIKDKGCTVDLLTNKVDEIIFLAGLKHFTALIDCTNKSINDINDNILPFAYSLTNEEIKDFNNGPQFGGDGCDPGCREGMCVNKTGLEIRWKYSKNTKDEDRMGLYANPIGTSFIYVIKQPLPQKLKGDVQVVINQKEQKYHIKLMKEVGQLYQKEAFCMKDGFDNILSPSTWEIIGTNPDPEKKRLLVFHLLPQRASRNFNRIKSKKRKYEEQSGLPSGPKCDDLTIKFIGGDYKLIKYPSPITTNTSTDSNSSTTTTTSSTTSTTYSTTSISSTTTKESPPPPPTEATSTTKNNPTKTVQPSTTSGTKKDDSTTSTSKETTKTNSTGPLIASISNVPVVTTTTTNVNTTTINTETTTKSSSNNTLIIVIVGILIIIGVGIAVYFLVIKKDSEGKEENVEESEGMKGITEVEATNIKDDDEKKEGEEDKEVKNEKENDKYEELKDFEEDEGSYKKKAENLTVETEAETKNTEIKEDDKEGETGNKEENDDDIYT
ncbi:unnamed protein product [Meloidogyne enterolobii]|uniref:Uncharacterized protein n=1 Tax=Meloidogyne enterolobii TaxID=390850 RepID=A0ACB0YLW5_MELEN